MRRRLLFTESSGYIPTMGGKLVIDSFTCPDIPAWGGTYYTGNVSYTYSNAFGMEYHSGGSVSFNPNSISANTLGTQEKPRTKIGSWTATVSMQGISASKTIDIFQAANVKTLSKIDAYWGLTGTDDGIKSFPASGGTLNYHPSFKYSFTSGSEQNTNSGNYTSQITDSSWGSAYNGTLTIPSRGTTLGGVRTNSLKVSSEGLSSDPIFFMQEPNTREMTSFSLELDSRYGDSEYVGADALGTAVVRYWYVDTYTYSSGATSTEYTDEGTLETDVDWMRDNGGNDTNIEIDNRGTTEGPERTGHVWGYRNGIKSNVRTVVQGANTKSTYDIELFWDDSPSTDQSDWNVNGSQKTTRSTWVKKTYRYSSGYTSSENDDYASDCEFHSDSDWIEDAIGSGTTTLGDVSFSQNTGTSRSGYIWCTWDGWTSNKLRIIQSAGEIHYGDLVIDSVSGPNDIPASGGKVDTSTINITYHQKYWYGDDQNSGGTVSSGATITYSGDVNKDFPAASADSGRKDVGDVNYEVSLNGKTATGKLDIYQSSNTGTLTGIEIRWRNDDNKAAASGETLYCDEYLIYTYSSGTTSSVKQGGNSFTYHVRSGSGVTATNSGCEWEYRGSTVGSERSATIYATYNDMTSNDLTTTQEANSQSTSYGNWNVSVSVNPTNVGPTGGKATVSASASRTKTVSYTSGHSYTETETATPKISISNTDGFTLSGNTITIGGYTGDNSRSTTITATYDKASATATLTQAARYKTYSEIKIISFTVSDISASGGTVTKGTVSYSQTWGWNGNTTNGGTITSGLTVTYSGSVNGSNLGTNVTSRTKKGSINATVSGNGKTATSSADVYQQANTATYGSVSLSGGSVSDIPASGGNTKNYYGQPTTASQTVSYTSGSTRNGKVTISSSPADKDIPNLGTTEKSRTKVLTKTATATGEGGKSASKTFDIYQQANTKIVDDWDLQISANPTTIAASGGESTVTATATRSYSFTSGSKGTESGTPTLKETKDDSNAFTLSGNKSGSKVSVGANPNTTERSVTITATIE